MEILSCNPKALYFIKPEIMLYGTGNSDALNSNISVFEFINLIVRDF
jgi:hypothetical protein